MVIPMRFENEGIGMVMVLSMALNTIIFLIILIKTFSSSITYRLYEFNRIKKHYIHIIVAAYCIIALFGAYYLYTLSIEGNYYLLYFLIIHAALILIISLLPAKKY